MERAIPGSMSLDLQSGALIRLRGLYPSLKTALQKVADVILTQPEMAIYASVNEVAAMSGVSEATVMRFCRTLGFKGFQDFKIALAREMVSPLPPLPEAAEEDTPAGVVRRMFQTNTAALQDTLEVLDMKAVEDAAQLLLKARQIMVAGVGSSGSMAAYATNWLFRLGFNVYCHNNCLIMMMAAALLTPEDVVVAISHSGTTREVVEIARVAREAGARVIGLTSNSLSPLARASDLVLASASRGTPMPQEAMVSRVSQVCLIDGLVTLVALGQPEKTRQNLAKIGKVIASRQF
jgi:DNA-binding MurR/RpiR family transcriptional regulator